MDRWPGWISVSKVWERVLLIGSDRHTGLPPTTQGKRSGITRISPRQSGNCHQLAVSSGYIVVFFSWAILCFFTCYGYCWLVYHVATVNISPTSEAGSSSLNRIKVPQQVCTRLVLMVAQHQKRLNNWGWLRHMVGEQSVQSQICNWTK